jgi:hypothetical protein
MKILFRKLIYYCNAYIGDLERFREFIEQSTGIVFAGGRLGFPHKGKYTRQSRGLGIEIRNCPTYENVNQVPPKGGAKYNKMIKNPLKMLEFPGTIVLCMPLASWKIEG